MKRVFTAVDAEITDQDKSIVLMQKAILRWGWQWTEKVFNDGHGTDCTLEFWIDKGHQTRVDRPLGVLGWGRFSRIQAWNMAYRSLMDIAPLEKINTD